MISSVRNCTTKVALLTLAVWLVSACHPLAQEKGGVSTDPDDRARCERQLNIIYGAIRQYRKQHENKLPAKLSDLRPEYIHDAKVLVCPFVKKRGGLQTWKKKFIDPSADAYTSYSYEYAPVLVEHGRWKGLPRKTWQEVKERVEEIVGSVVPIVRCHDHFPWLNLSVGGPIYESESVYWELNFVEDEDLLLVVANIFPSPPPRALGPGDFPPRDPSASSRMLDLGLCYNAKLEDSWQGLNGNHLGGFRIGVREFDGVRFDVRGVIQLRGTDVPSPFPEQKSCIEVHQKCSRIHFLHALSSVHRSGSTQASYSIHYAGGEVQKFPLIYGQQIADWWYDPRNPAPPSEATVAWAGQNEAAKAHGMAVRLYHAVWENPIKDTEIETITFQTLPKRYFAGPFVVAITLE